MIPRRLKVFPERCSGCRICELVCSMAHLNGGFNPKKGLIRIDVRRTPDITTPVSQIDVPNICLQCDPAPCVTSCTVEAFKWDQALGVWRIDEGACVGCGVCVDECPQGVVKMHNDTAMKCDLCEADPLCARCCPTGALIFCE